MILSDVQTAKTVDEIGVTIKHLRITEFTRKCIHYKSAVAHLGAQQPNSISAHFGVSSDSSAISSSVIEFSSFEDPEGYNEIAQPTAETIKQFYTGYVNEREEILNQIMEDIVPHAAMSFDATYHIQKTTKAQLTSGKFISVPEDAHIFFQNATGEICVNVESEGETKKTIVAGLKKIKDRCERLGVPYPQFFTCDNVHAWEVTIKSVFPDAIVLQDLKHLINRCIEAVGTGKEGAAEFSVSFHGAFTAKKNFVVKSRTGVQHYIDAPLPSGQFILEAAEGVVQNFKANYPNLLTANFDTVWETQKKIIPRYIKDPIANGFS